MAMGGGRQMAHEKLHHRWDLPAVGTACTHTGCPIAHMFSAGDLLKADTRCIMLPRVLDHMQC